MPSLGAATKQSRTKFVLDDLKVFIMYFHFGQHFIFRCIAVNCRFKQATMSGRCNFSKCMTFVVKYA